MNSKIVICGARSGSKRVINKNIRVVGDYPLIVYTLDTAKSLGYPTYVSSDSDEILDTVQRYSTATAIKRPEELASDTATDYDWIYHLLQQVYEKTNEYPEQLIFLRPTTPFRCVRTIQNAIERFDKNKYTSLRSIEELSESSYKTFFLDNGFLRGFSEKYQDLPNQQVPPTYKSNGYVDILQTKQIIEFDSLYGNSIMPFITENTVEIDTERDIKYANWLIEGEK
jgi:CMP-N-acetylneuraminic acid synthetase